MWMRLALILSFLPYFAGDCFGCAVAVMSFEPQYTVCSNESVDCNGAGSYDTDDSGSGIVSWKWDFDNDGDYDDASGESPSFSYSEPNTYLVGLKVEDNEGDTHTTSGSLIIVEPNVVISLQDGTCVECYITFILFMDGGAIPYVVEWSAPGGDPSSGEGGPIFSTRWSSSGSKTVTATICDTDKSKTVTIASVTNFSEDSWLDLGNGVLYFEYSWDSSSGELNDLNGCKVGEKVDYSGGNPYTPDDPPFNNWSFNNPTVGYVAATGGSCSDTHNKGGGFSTPYSAKSFTATQKYRVRRCGGSHTSLRSISIVRSVFESSGWKYKVEKSGHSSIMDLP